MVYHANILNVYEPLSNIKIAKDPGVSMS